MPIRAFQKKKRPSWSLLSRIGVPGGIRTPDPRLRRPLLYPAELPERREVFHRAKGAIHIIYHDFSIVKRENPFLINRESLSHQQRIPFSSRGFLFATEIVGFEQLDLPQVHVDEFDMSALQFRFEGLITDKAFE